MFHSKQFAHAKSNYRPLFFVYSRVDFDGCDKDDEDAVGEGTSKASREEVDNDVGGEDGGAGGEAWAFDDDDKDGGAVGAWSMEVEEREEENKDEVVEVVEVSEEELEWRKSGRVRKRPCRHPSIVS